MGILIATTLLNGFLILLGVIMVYFSIKWIKGDYKEFKKLGRKTMSKEDNWEMYNDPSYYDM